MNFRILALSAVMATSMSVTPVSAEDANTNTQNENGVEVTRPGRPGDGRGGGGRDGGGRRPPGDRPGKPPGDRPGKPPGDRPGKPPGDRPGKPPRPPEDRPKPPPRPPEDRPRPPRDDDRGDHRPPRPRPPRDDDRGDHRPPRPRPPRPPNDDIFDPGRPDRRYVYVGQFRTSNPFKTDTDSFQVNFRGRVEALVFSHRGGADVDLESVRVYCGGGRECGRVSGSVRSGRSARFGFRNPVRIESITVKSRPTGLPPAEVNVYLDTGY